MVRSLVTRLLVPLVCGVTACAAVADCDNPRPPEMISRADGFTADVAAFGWCMDADAQTMIVSDPWAHQAAGTQRGLVQIHRRTGTGWVREAVIEAVPGWSRFGDSSAVSGDIAAVAREGFIHIYERIVSTDGTAGWTSSGVVPINRALAVVVDGATVYAGVHSSTPGGADGEVWEIVREPVTGNWTPRRVVSGIKFAVGNGVPHLAVSGETMVVADPGYPFPPFGRAGDVRVFRRQGGAWTFEASLPGRSLPANAGDGFGNCVSVDGDTVAVGANWDPSPSLAGYARVFHRDGAGAWQLEGEFNHPNYPTAPPRTAFAMSVVVRGDVLAIGSPQDLFAGPGAGAVFVYRRDAGAWSSRGSFTLSDAPGSWVGWNTRIVDGSIVASALGLDGVGGAVVFDSCSVVGQPGDRTPRCLPGILGLLTFLDAFFTGDSFADFNHSGYVSVQDVFEYLAAWFGGC